MNMESLLIGSRRREPLRELVLNYMALVCLEANTSSAWSPPQIRVAVIEMPKEGFNSKINRYAITINLSCSTVKCNRMQ